MVKQRKLERMCGVGVTTASAIAATAHLINFKRNPGLYQANQVKERFRMQNGVKDVLWALRWSTSLECFLLGGDVNEKDDARTKLTKLPIVFLDELVVWNESSETEVADFIAAHRPNIVISCAVVHAWLENSNMPSRTAGTLFKEPNEARFGGPVVQTLVIIEAITKEYLRKGKLELRFKGEKESSKVDTASHHRQKRKSTDREDSWAGLASCPLESISPSKRMRAAKHDLHNDFGELLDFDDEESMISAEDILTDLLHDTSEDLLIPNAAAILPDNFL